MKSYFFIPANRIHKVADIQKLKVDEIVVDLEDGIKSSELDKHLQEIISKSDSYTGFFIRIPLHDASGNVDCSTLVKLKSSGFTNFILPKIKNLEQFEKIVVHLTLDDTIILLIETPLLLVQLSSLLEKYKNYIFGVALGSHDLMSVIGAKHTEENILFYRDQLLLLAKAYGKKAMDVTSMELERKVQLTTEIMDGFNKGFDAKFFIHPWQIDVLNNISFYELDDLKWAKTVMEVFDSVKNTSEFNPIVVDGLVIEKPHLNKAFSIIKYFERNEVK